MRVMGRTRPNAVFETAACGGAALAVLLLLLWARRLDPALLAMGAVVTLITALLTWRARREPAARWLWAALAALLAVLAVGAWAQSAFHRIEFEWDQVAAERDQRLSAVLGRSMAALTERGRRAAELAAQPAPSDSLLFARLAEARERAGVDALMVFGPDGALIAWAGDHRGRIPDAIRSTPGEAYFAERPLYSYLYFTAPVKGSDRHAVAAVLVETGAPLRSGAPTLNTTFAARTNVPAVFRPGAGSGAGIAWRLVTQGDTVVYARLDPVTQAQERARVELQARRGAVAAAFLALLLAWIGWLRRTEAAGARRLSSAAPLVVAAIGSAIAPMGAVLGMEDRAAALAFLLPVPGVSLGDLLAVIIAGAALGATLRAPRADRRTWPIALVLVSAGLSALYALTLQAVIAATAPSFQENGSALWLGLQIAATLLLTLFTATLMPRRREAQVDDDGRVRIGWLVASLALGAALGAAVQAHTYAQRAAAPVLAALWVAPLVLLAVATADARGPGQRLTRWVAAGALAATAVLPQLWGANVNARLRAAEHELDTFGQDPPTVVNFMLERFSREALARSAAGEDGLQLLYRSWVASGLAQEPYGVRITLWRGQRVQQELSLGGAEGSDSTNALMRQLIAETSRLDGPRANSIPGFPTASSLLTVPLDSERVISVSVEPRRTLQRTGIVASFFGRTTDGSASVALVSAPDVKSAGETRWLMSADGWRSEAKKKYPDGWYHAHMEVRFARLDMRLARATLLVTLDVALLALLWLLGHVARGLPVVDGGALRNWLSSFRARITFALFLFFLVPTVVFGLVAYRGISAVVVEAAGTVADRAARQAVLEMLQSNRNLRELSVHAGADVLRYLGGELIDASSPEGMELGIYGAWLPPAGYRALESNEETSVREITHLERQSFLTAYHSMRPSGTLGVPVALSVGDTATRQRDVRDLTLLAAVLGLLLSAVLSVAVGRQLAGPIGQLRRAAAAVGAGRLSVRLPEPGGEFGLLFASFNRMVRRLRRARVQEVRTARVLAWGEMAQQIAHEIKNPLTPIKLAVQHLRRAYGDRRSDFGEILDENVDNVLTEIGRLTEIARAFSRYGAPTPQAGPLRHVDVGAVVHETLTLYRAGDSAVHWDEELDPGLPPGRARAGELREVLMNLLENARDAVGADGNVTVSAQRVDGRIELHVADDGPGIPAELLPRIFDPHFSTRSSGTGLGLAIVRRLVESWGGSVSVDSRPGEGTRFTVRIAASDDAAATHHGERPDAH